MTDQLAAAALKRLREFINRSAAQHLAALRKRAKAMQGA